MRIRKSFFNRTATNFRLLMAALMTVSFIGSSDPVLAAAGLPDLVITNVTVTDMADAPITEVNAEQTIKVNVTLDNIGGDDYEDCTDPGEIIGDNCTVDEIYRDVYIGTAPVGPDGCHPNGRWSGTQTTLLLADDGTDMQTLSVTFNNADAGERELYVYVDINCSIDETNDETTGTNNNSFGPIPITVNAVGCAPPTGGPQIFSDVPTNYWARDYIEALYYCGYTAGCSASPLQYCPEKGMSRVESAVFILRGNYGSTYTTPDAPWDSFADDWTPGPWGEKWAEGLYQAGLTAGCGTNPLRFCPWDQTPRLQLAVFAVRLRNGETFSPPPATGTVFADITDPNLWYAKWAEKAYADGLIPSCGTQGGKPLFCPNTGATRALAAYAIAKAKNLVP